MIVGVNWCLASQWRAGDLAAAVGDHLVHVHVELRPAARHPHMQRKHFMMLTREDFVADLNDQLVALLVEPFAGIVCIGGCFLQDGVGGNHFAGNQILADAEVLERTLSLRAPEFISSNIYFPEAIGFLPNVCHLVFPFPIRPFGGLVVAGSTPGYTAHSCGAQCPLARSNQESEQPPDRRALLP